MHSYRYRGGVFDGRAWQPWYSVLPDEGEKATEDLGSQSVTEMFGHVWATAATFSPFAKAWYS